MLIRNIGFFLFLCLQSSSIIAQDNYLIFFKDKGSLKNYPTERLLSDYTLENRNKQGIGVDHFDLPLKVDYLRNLTLQGLLVKSTSKWLNAAMVSSTQDLTVLLREDASISKIQALRKRDMRMADPMLNLDYSDYGMNAAVAEKFNLKHFHDEGFRGEGVRLAILDVGFGNLDGLSVFAHLFDGEQILDTYDFIEDTTAVYESGNHGTMVSSYILTDSVDLYKGFAPDVDVMFYATDDYYTETAEDEYNFVRALERADSIGVDIVSASLGYSVFDDIEDTYDFSDMDGYTSISTIGCNIAANKGILIVTSAGNSGTITAPSDAFGIISVGGSKMNKYYDQISSRGNTYDGRTCPLVSGITKNVFAINGGSNNPYEMSYGGTSSATPQVAGFAACLKQKHPEATKDQLLNAIKNSGHLAPSPNDSIGYGVPNAIIADSLLTLYVGVSEYEASIIDIYPNPSKGLVYFSKEMNSVSLISLTGKTIQLALLADQKSVDVSKFPMGMYILKLMDEQGEVFIHELIVK